MENVNWQLVAVLCGIGILVAAFLGFFIGRRTGRDQKRIRELEGELADSRSEQEAYRQQVNNHFLKTSELFGKMTDSYRAVFLHLAEGSQELCTNDAAKLKAAVDSIPALVHDHEEAGESAADSASGPAEPASPAAEQAESSSMEQVGAGSAPAGAQEEGAGEEEETPQAGEEEQQEEAEREDETPPGEEDTGRRNSPAGRERE